MSIDLNKLPAYARFILSNYLAPKNMSVPVESLLLTLNVFCSNFICYNRVKISCEELNINDTFPNIYGLGFMPSGSGKDKPIGEMEELLTDLFNEREQREQEYIEKEKERIKAEAESVYGDSGKVAKQKYIDDREPRGFTNIYNDGTIEGFIAMRKFMRNAGFGHTCFMSSEFLDYIESPNATRENLLTAIKEAFDSGSTKAKLIKGEINIQPVKDVPSTMLCYSAFGNLFSKSGDNTKQKLYKFLSMGIARRSFVFVSEKMENIAGQMLEIGVKESFDFYIEEQKKAQKHKTEIIKIFNAVISACNYDSIPSIYLSEKAKLKYFEYKLQKEDEGNKISEIEQEGWRTDVINRFWKMIKLAGVIAIFEHPEKWEITEKDIEMAIYQAEYYSQYLKKLYEKDDKLEVEKVFDLIYKKPEGITKTELRKYCNKNNLAKWGDNQTKWVDDIIKQLKEYCGEKGLTFNDKGKTNAEKRLRIEKPKEIPKEFPDLDNL